ncbi:retinol dehydrogenase 12-like isoform X3 [Artemia franciscana]|uniref:Uncharacterized protein n=1 Tax=Artemia franciscana TaxID=6661 RepID=A0AA88HIS2_ARTSF|nr:hypothetical protein QYM36_016477 [Artemia franciscana]
MWLFELSWSTQTIIFLASLILVIKIYLHWTCGVCTSTKRLDGKTVIITGANTGIGKETAMDMALRGARVILACRNLDRANAARDEIIASTRKTNVIVKHLDLASLKSVRAFAHDILKTENRLDILINNAGLAALGPELTEDGLDNQMQSNHFGHFLLTNMLLGLIKKSAPSRIINVASEAHRFPRKLDFDNLNFKTDGKGLFKIYGVTKLCNVLFTKELASRLKGTGTIVFCLHPGSVKTDVGRNCPLWLKCITWPFCTPFFKSAKEGAQTTIYLAVTENLEGLSGSYFSDCKVAKESKLAKDEGLAKKLWEVSEELVKIQKDELHL